MKLLGLLGYPVAHSFSPGMINTIARKNSWDCSYYPFAIPQKKIKDFIQSVKILPISGFNVTAPYKQIILEFCDTLSSEVRIIKAANTIINQNGKLVAENTDVAGFIYGLEKLVLNRQKLKKVLILGAGGAARASVFALSNLGVKHFFVANRNPDRKKNWQTDFVPLLDENLFDFIPLTPKAIMEILPDIELIVQTTPVGTWPDNLNVLEFPFENLTAAHCVFDLVYNPPETKFISLAKKYGAKTESGLSMLAAQAAKSLQMWDFVSSVEETLQALKQEINKKN